MYINAVNVITVTKRHTTRQTVRPPAQGGVSRYRRVITRKDVPLQQNTRIIQVAINHNLRNS